MRLGLALLLLTAFALCTSQARAEYLVRWEQPDWIEGDSWEIRWDCTADPAYQPLEPLWGSEGLRAGLSEPAVVCTAVARTWREGAVSAESEPRVYVPEPPWLLGVLAGLSALGALSARRSPPARATR